MDSLIEPGTHPSNERQDSSLRPILVGIVIVGVVVAVLALIFRSQQKKPDAPPVYAAHLKFSDLKMSAAQNFVGATVNYLDGTVTNTGDKTVTHAVVQVTFKDAWDSWLSAMNSPSTCYAPPAPTTKLLI